jgi:hypothetical protein
MATTEIEKLERRYAENPQGLTFAPLAEVHRKNGDIPRALELLRTGLELHPNYIPASIVLGRCHWDQGDLPAAEAAFSHVLRLDDENVIALKSLADISERLGRGHEAQRWLNRLITIDRSNEEARQHLARLEAVKGEPAATPAAPPLPTSAPPESKREAPAPPAKEIAATPPPAVHPTAAPELPPLDLTAAIAEPGAAAPSSQPDPTSTQPPKTPALQFLDTEPAKDAERTSAPSAEPAPLTRTEISDAEEPAAPVAGLISQEFVPPKEGGYRLHPELTQEFGAGIEPPDTLEVETAEELELQSSGASEFRVPNAAEEFMDAAGPVEPVVPPILEPVAPRAQPTTRPPEPTRQPSYSVRDTHGQSVASFFRSLLASRPPGSPATSSPAQQDREAPQGSSRGAGEDSVPNPPTVPAAGNASDAAVSFDDFFGTPGGETNAPKGSSKAGEDDLDQFQSWLQILKR